MTERIDQRIRQEALFIVQNRATVRQTAAKYGVSKSTVHKDMTERLKHMDAHLYRLTRRVLDVNKAERHLRGGEATMRKFRNAGKNSAK